MRITAMIEIAHAESIVYIRYVQSETEIQSRYNLTKKMKNEDILM